MDIDADDPAIHHYNDGNRAFIQAIMARATLNLKEGKRILAAIFTAQDNGKETLPEDVTEEDFNSYIAAATSVLSPFDYEIRDTVHQVSKERIYAIVNSSSDTLTQLATTRNAEEIAFIKRVLDAMFETYNTPRQEIMGVTEMQAMKLAKGDGRSRQSLNGTRNEGGEQASQAANKGLLHSQVERLMRSMVAEGWLERSKDGWYTLSPRALMELKSWLVSTYNDDEADADEWQRIKFCEACKGILTIGQRCASIDCNVRLHDVCHEAFWRTKREKKCPRCEKDWTGRNWVGEKAITTGEAWLKGKRRSGGSKRGEVIEDDDQDGQEEEE